MPRKFKIWDTSDSYLNQQEITVHCLDIQADELNAVDFHFTDSMRMVVLASRKGPTARCIQLAVTHNQYGEDPAPIRFQVVVEHHFRLSSDLLCKTLLNQISSRGSTEAAKTSNLFVMKA